MNPLEQIKLHSLMKISKGSRNVAIGIIDGPVDFSHPAFQSSKITTVKDSQVGECKSAGSMACLHGTFIVGILCATRGISAPAICPDCKLILRPIFHDSNTDNGIILPSSTPKELSSAIIETVDAGAKIINLSLGLSDSSLIPYDELRESYNYACRNNVIIVLAVGNNGSMGYTPLLNHPWIIPVAACDEYGRLAPISNFGLSIGNHGLLAPGIDIQSTAPGGKFTSFSGTSIATPFVTGAIALLWSIYPEATVTDIKYAILGSSHNRRTVIPPLLNAESALYTLRNIMKQRSI